MWGQPTKSWGFVGSVRPIHGNRNLLASLNASVDFKGLLVRLILQPIDNLHGALVEPFITHGAAKAKPSMGR